MAVPAQLSPLRGGSGFPGLVSFALGLVAAFGTAVYAVWLAVAAVAGMGAAAEHASGAAAGAALHSGAMHATNAVAHSAPAQTRPAAAVLPAATPTGSTLAFDQLWISRNGNTIVAGVPTVGVSALTGESMIQVPVTLTNNGERDWIPESTGFVGTLNHAPIPESTEGDWMYRSPIVPHTSVTLTKVFVSKPGQFGLTVNTPDGVASFAGQV
ncbi:MAG TPA: hypothetical protein VF003_05515 [Pseudonocardiaceae bacterium]